MCKIALAINYKETKNKDFENLLQLQFEKLEHEPHGCAAVIIDRKNKMKVFRSYEDYDSVFRAASDNFEDARLVALHTRTATCGNKDLENVHFFEIDGRLFCHNGFVSKFSGFKQFKTGFHFTGAKASTILQDENISMGYNQPSIVDELSIYELQNIIADCKGCFGAKKGYCKSHEEHYLALEAADGQVVTIDLTKDDKREILPPKSLDNYSDSYQFLLTLPKDAGVDEIERHVIETNFSGMGVLIDKNQNKIFLVIKKKCYTVTDSETFAGFFSYNPTLKESIETIGEISGIPYVAGEKKVEVAAKERELVEGTYVLSLKNTKVGKKQTENK